MNRLRIGLTGNMGSGKSTAAKIFRFLGVPVFDADAEARDLLEYDDETRRGVLNIFGQQAFHPNGLPNRGLIGKAAFKDSEKLRALNNIIHPKIRIRSDLWHEGHNEAYTIYEAALLVESGSYERLDALVVVSAPSALKINRVAARNGWSRRHIRERLKNQRKQRELLILADYVIKNDGNHLLIPQVLSIHGEILKKCGRAAIKPSF
ncbi:MAG: dephospho-CoA kinase [Bacteroidetes bacterium]|nr:dephospho-CoA kinase [Bacteroidota bacterium]